MRSFWSDPYLWIHLAGLATLPIWLELCLLGLAVGDPVLPPFLELFLVGVIGIAPILWMQWQRPFDIYSLLAVSLKPERLTEDQRKLLTLFTAQRNRFLAIGVAIVLAIVLQKLYIIAPIASSITPFASGGRFVGLLVATIAFLGANLFTQVPVAVLSVLLTTESTYAATLPFAIDQVPQRFTLLGWPINQILPAIVAEPPRPTVPVAFRQPPSKIRQTSAETGVEKASPDVVTPLNSDDLEDIWDAPDPSEVAAAPNITLTEEPSKATLDAIEAGIDAELPVEKPDLLISEVKSEDVKTEEDSSSEPIQPESDATASTEESWLDAPLIDDPGAAEPPSSP